MEQYPDSITIVTYASASQNASGLWTEGASASYIFDCRAEINSVGRKIPGDDGSLVDYAFTVYMPATTTIISRGSDFVLTSLHNGIVTGKVKGAQNGQLNSRIWL